MRILSGILALVFLVAAGTMCVAAQGAGALDVQVKTVKVGGKPIKISRKRFYLLRGGLEANKDLVSRLKVANFTSRDCYYCQLHTSKEYIAWLKEKDCESPYCRQITTEDIAKVPEFQAAYQKGTGGGAGKGPKLSPKTAEKWVTTNLSPELRDGFYRQRKSLTDTLLGGVKPLQSSMTDTAAVKAQFIDILLTGLRAADPKKPDDKTETFLVTNLFPLEVGDKSYVWACEIEVGTTKTAKLTLADPPETSKRVKNCEVIVRQLPTCNQGTCSQ
ncbi:MAG: hypothetical protein ABJB40_01410 [Acidobacteriota bacterium]